jgi:hypothetical protein
MQARPCHCPHGVAMLANSTRFALSGLLTGLRFANKMKKLP